MFKKADLKGYTVEVVNTDTDTLVPKDHLLRCIDQAIDFTCVYDFVEGLYCPDNRRPGEDSVVLMKMVFIEHLYGIPSLRQTVRDIDMNRCHMNVEGFNLRKTNAANERLVGGLF